MGLSEYLLGGSEHTTKNAMVHSDTSSLWLHHPQVGVAPPLAIPVIRMACMATVACAVRPDCAIKPGH